MTRVPAPDGPITRRGRWVAAVLAVLLTTALTALPAHAAGYRFWGYYEQVEGAWAFHDEGPAATVPEDGAVEGWRFALAEDGDTRFPRDTPSHADVCGGAAVADGHKSVAVVVDHGRTVDAVAGETPPDPAAYCVVAAEDATGLELLETAVGEVRVDPSGLVCGVGGYPSAGCGDPVEEVPELALAPDPVVPIAVQDPVGGGAGDAEETTTAPATSEDTGAEGGDPEGEESAGEDTGAAAAEEDSDGGTLGLDALPFPWWWLLVVLLLALLLLVLLRRHRPEIEVRADGRASGDERR